MAKRILNDLKLSRIAAVDRPCQEGAKAHIFKRAPDGIYMAKAEGDPDLDTNLTTYLKRLPEDAAFANGVCLPDGTFPIETRADLRKAVAVLHRAPDTAKARAHIIVKAREIDATNILPADWNAEPQLLKNVTNDEAIDGFEKAVDAFTAEIAKVDDYGIEHVEPLIREYANVLLSEVEKSVTALVDVAAEIDADASVVNKAEALQESSDQFKAHLKGFIPDGAENALVVAALSEAGFEISEGGALTKRENDMGASIEMKKSLGLPATATDADVQKAIDAQKASADFGANVAKMKNPAHLAYMAKGANLPDGGAPVFAAMTDAQRDEVLKKFPPEMSDEDKKKAKDEEDAKKALQDAADLAKKAGDEVLTVDGAEIRKSVVGDGVFAILKSQQVAIEKAADVAAVAVIKGRADVDLKHIGKSDDLAAMLHGIAKRDPKLAEQVETVLKAADAKIAKGGLFTEIGKSAQGVTGNAAAQIETLAQAEVAKGAQTSIYKARDFVRKANPELAKLEETERKTGQKAA